MRKASAFIIIVLAVAGTGCVLKGKSSKTVVAAPPAPKTAAAAPAPPPPPLSIPQTQVELPQPQPLDPAALVTEPAQPVEQPVETSNPKPPPSGRRTPPPRSEAAGAGVPGTQTPALPPNVAPPETTLPTIQEIVPEQEKKRLLESAAGRRRQAQQIADQLVRRPLNAKQKEVIANINSFIASSLDAEKKGDAKLADALAERAQVLAKDLQNAK